MKRSILFTRRQIVTSSLAALGAAALPAVAPAGETLPPIHVYKSPSCGCCGAWVEIVRRAGFTVTVTETDDLDPIKQQAGIADELMSCHTAVVDGYVVEGHVPVPALRKLITERPKVRGIAVPGMPDGSPGMGYDPNARYDVVTFGSQSTPDGQVFYRAGQ